jgi:hypothetical protein
MLFEDILPDNVLVCKKTNELVLIYSKSLELDPTGKETLKIITNIGELAPEELIELN